MKRLVLLLFTAIVVTLPPSLILVMIGGIATAGLSSGALMRITSASAAATIPGVMMLTVTATTISKSPSPLLKLPLAAVMTTSWAMMASPGSLSSASVMAYELGGVVVNDAPMTADSETFKVSVLGQSKGGSPTCTFSLVEFTNTHPRDDIIIHSAHIEPSVVFPSGHAIFNEASSNSELPPAPPDVEYPFDRTLHLRPGTVTTVPVSIYPHWRRSFDNGSNRLQHSSTAVSGQPASIYHMSTHRNESSVILDSNSESIRADLADILKNSQDYMFMSSAGITLSPDRQIHETLVANTSWGFLQMKAPYLCIPNSRELKFGLAHNVMFIDGGGGWYAPPTSFRTTCDNLDPFVYHVFMNNPSAKSSIRIWEVFTTQPEFVRVEYHSYRPQCRAEDTFISNELEGISTRIPPGATNFYVSTIRLLPENFNSTMFSSYIDLGFLELRTSVSHFTVGLSFIPNKGKKNIVHGLVNSTTVGHIHLAKSKAMEVAASRILREKQIKGNSSIQMGVIKSYRSSGATPVASTQQLSNQLDKDQHIASINPNGLGNEPPSISTSPVNINFGIITSGSRMSRVPVNIINNFGHAVRVMRISVTLKTVMEEGVLVNDIINETHKFDVGVDFIGKQVYHLSSTRGDDKESFQIGGDVVIPPHSILKRPITVRSMFNPSLEHLVLPRSYTGSIIIWVTGDLNATYLEWEQQLISHKSFGSEYITEVPFEAAILPGNFEISTDTVLFPSHFSMLSKEERARTKLRTNAKSPETFDRELEITNNFAVPVSVTKIQIADTGKDDDLCHKYFSTPLFDSLTEAQQPKADRKESLKGVSVRFHFPSDENIGPFPKKCMLSLDTDRVGRQNLPLIIYSGELIGDLDLPDGRRVNKDCMRTVNNSPTTSSGMPCIHDWVERSVAGKILSDAILHMQQTRSRQMTWPQLCVEKSHDPLESYFLQLFPADHGKIHSLQPIVIPVGSVNAGDVVTRSVFLTNLNHVPVEVTTSSAAFENVNIAIGVTQASLQSLMMKMKNKGKHDIAYFLAESPVAKDILSNLTASVDIALSSRADGSELPSLFARHHIVQTFDDSTNFLDETMAEDRHGIMKCSCGFLLSTDGSTHVETSTKMISSNKWSIPPGGIARYSIQIRVPDKISLRSDITSFVQTGLMLQTNYGQAMPIILTYSALVGKLQLIPAREMMETNFSLGDDNFDNQNNQLEHVDVEVPMRIRDSSPAGATFEHEGIPLQIESTFSHDLYLSEVRSCNKWFRVKVSPENIKNWPLSNHNITGYHDLNVSKVVVIKAGNVSRSSSYRPAVVPIGFVHSMMSCPKFVKSKSFFSCALEWLEKRDTIQPHGCGNRVDDLLKESFEVGKMKEIQSRTISILRNVVDYLSHRYGGNTAGKSEIDNFGEVNSRKYVPYSFIELVQSAWTAWRDIESIGLNIVTGHVTATTMYISNDKIESQQKNQHSPLTIPVSSVLLKSTLSIPRLFQGRRESSVGVVEFDSTRISETTIRFVPVVNPTDSTIHVRLSATLGADDSTFKSVHVQNSASESHPWWTGGSYWMSDFDGHLISASHNVTIKSGGGAFVSLINPSLHSMSAFVLGCGMRCGLQNGADSDAQDKLYSTIGSASGENVTLIGRHHVSIPMPKYSQSPVDVLGMSDPPSFALGRISTEEVIIPPYGSAKLGPVFFRPPSRGIFSSSIFLENSLNGYEEVKIVGRGMWEKIVFLDSEVSGGGGDIEFRFGRSALVFPGSATTLEGLPVVKSVVVANLGDIPVNISNIRMTSSETMHFSRRKPPPALFRYNSISSIIRRVRNSAKSSRDCSHRGFNIVGCVESSFNSWSEKWFYWLNEMKKLLSFVPTRTVERLDQNGFTLNPNENTTLFIEHRPDCTFQTLYTSLILEVNDGNRPPNKRRSPTFSDETFRDEKLELLVGYDMSAYEMKHCVPYSPPRTRAWDKTFIVPSIVQDIGSFGLTRWTDANGNPIIPMRPIEMSYLSAFFLFILFLLAFDLMIELDSQSDNRKKCTNWKSTSRCLARADPTSSDLIALGKEQTKHVLLSRLKKDGVLPSQCVQSDGSFTRERFGSYITSAPPKPSDVNNASTPMRRVTLANQQARTLSDALFSQHNLMKSANKTTEWESESERAVSLPCGLKWRIALRRGIAFCQSRINDDTDSSPVRRYLKRYRDRRVKKNIEKQSSTPRQYAPVNTTQHDVSLVAKRHDAHVNVKTIDRVSNDEGNHHLVKEEPKSTNGNIHSVPSKNNHVGHPLKDVETNNNSKSHSETKVALARDESATVLNENYSVNSQQTRVRVGKVELSPTQLKHKPLKDVKQLKEDRTISSKSEKKKEVPKGDGSSASSKTKTLKKNSFQNTAVGQKTTSARTNNGKHELQSRNHPSTPSQQVVIASHEVKNSRHVKTPKDETKSSESKRGSQRKQGRSKAKRTSLPELPAANMNSKTQEPTPREVSTKKSDHPLIVTQLPEADFPPLSSIPSSPKNEATSEGTTTHSRQPDVPTPPSPKATLRPPPGLLPPPGFSYDETNTPPILSPLNSTSHHTSPVKMTQLSDRVHGHDISESSFFDLHQRELSQSPPLLQGLLFGARDDDESFPIEHSSNNSIQDTPVRTISDNSIRFSGLRPPSLTPPVLESLSTETHDDVHTLLGANSDFNVTSFLDGLLSDSTQTERSTDNMIDTPALSAEPLIHFNASAVPLDPWNSSSESSRNNPLAAVIGKISNAESMEDEYNQETVIAGIPLKTSTPSLLTPSAFQNVGSFAEPAYASLVSERNDEDDTDSFLEPDSFYNQLLGED